jgi:hypothetical protein
MQLVFESHDPEVARLRELAVHRRRLSMRRLAWWVPRTKVMLSDINAPRGGVDKRLWEYTVLVTNAPYELTAIGQLYRDGCDCDNGLDDLKNHWGRARTRSVLRADRVWRGARDLRGRGLQGWGGFTTQDMHRSQVNARCGLVYNWWSWYVRASDPQGRREALTSRPLLLAAVGRANSGGNQTTLYLMPMQAEAGLIKSMIAYAHAAIQHVKAAAEQLPKLDRWRALLVYSRQRIAGPFGLATAPPRLAALR